jgi:hypothetical protein
VTQALDNAAEVRMGKLIVHDAMTIKGAIGHDLPSHG